MRTKTKILLLFIAIVCAIGGYFVLSIAPPQTIYINTRVSSFDPSSNKSDGVWSPKFLNKYHRIKKFWTLEKESEYNGMLAADAFNRALIVERNWIKKIQQPIGLVPRNESAKWQKWLGRDNGADLLPYLLISSYFFDRENYQIWLKMLNRQTELCDGLSCWLDLASGEKAFTDPEEIAFDTGELLKDGFMPLLEWVGQDPFLSIGVSMANKLIPLCQRKTEHGVLCARRSEINGDLMMVLSHLWLITGNDQYREFVKKMVDAYVYDIFPRFGGLFPEKLPNNIDKPGQFSLVMGDHANEIVQGFGDYCYALFQKKHPDFNWCLQEFNSLIKFSLQAPRGPEGLWFRKAHIPKQEKDTDARSDVWGYLVNSFRLYDFFVGAPTYEPEVKRIIEGVISLGAYPWENNFYDGNADTIESMIYSLPYEPEAKLEQWVDSETQRMFAKQAANGKLDGGYLEGNFIRTAMLYGLLKTKGARLEKWRDDLLIGGALSENQRKFYISIVAKSPWIGMLRFDSERHLQNMNLEHNYPRINTTIEWFAIKPENDYKIILNDKDLGVKKGSELLKGIEISVR